ncbi:hypothetical protein ACIA03_23435 [Nocardioides sp. NPDC051685]|uniref:hypothetical protein n=1 Tax=Nocardioides sp. NPDC051685 TaxID=3364334 RepID=UPI0037B90918
MIVAVALLPALAWSIASLLRPIRQMAEHLEHVVDDLNETVGSLDAIPDLAETVMLTGAGRPGAERYREAVRRAR